MKDTFALLRISWGSRVADSEKGVAFLSNTIVRILFFFGLLPTVASIIVLLIFIHPMQNAIVLHYDVYFGVDLLGNWWQAYLLPIFSFCLAFGHLALASFLYRRMERIAAYLLLFGSGLIGFSVLIASVGIAYVNY